MTTPTTATSTTSDGPVLSIITKRLRSLRKKLTKITQMETSLSQGKTLNPEQLSVLQSKPSVLTLIDELDKLRAPLSAALDEELSLALSKSHLPPKSTNDNDNDNNLRDLVNVMYFGSLFDVKQQSEFTPLMLTKTHERSCCLTYDYVNDDNDNDMLGERDLDLISGLQGLMISRPVNSSLSHRNAIEECFEHAKLWIENSNQPIGSHSNVTYATLREKLNKIMSSDYLTATPQMKGQGEVAAAAAVANFGSFQVPLHESMVNAEVPIQVEGSPEQYQEMENAANHEEYETTEQPGDVEEAHKDESEPENPPEVVSVPSPTDQEQYQNIEGDGYKNVDFKDNPRKSQRSGGRGGSGGGRRGYSNGRGGRGTGRGNGPYHNGRNQYYDNSYPRNYYNRRGRPGANGGSGGGEYYNNASGAQGNHSQANIGVEA